MATRDQDIDSDAHATLRIYDVDPDVVGVLLPMGPFADRVQKLKRRDGARVDGWLLPSKGSVASSDLEEHLNWIVERMKAHPAELRQLRDQGGRIDVFCYLFSMRGHGGPTLSAELLRAL